MRSYSQTFMKTRIRLLLIAALALPAGAIASLAEPILSWHTSMGSLGEDTAEAIAVDGSGNIYVAGWTESTWGNPIHPYAGGRDAFLAKLNSSGERLWHTFMGTSGWDEGISVAVDGDGNVYVTGISDASWGTPVHNYSGDSSTFAAKFDGKNGEIQWNTFMGGGLGRAIAVDTSGNVYVAGWGGVSWDTPPINPSVSTDAWVVKLNSLGVMQWYTNMGTDEDMDTVRSMAVDGDGNVFVAGRSMASWGSPINSYAGGESDAFLAKLNTSGVPQWHTFMGSAGGDFGMGVAVDGSGNAYFSGSSTATWGDPINPFAPTTEDLEGFAAKLNPDGEREWHTFLGSEGVGFGWGMAIDENRNIFTGDRPHSVQLSPDGIIQRHFSIPHGNGGEYQPIAVDTSGNVYFAGFMDEHWWIEPISPAIVRWTDGGGRDACVVKFETSVEIDIDIKPGSDPNCFNINSHGVIPVAILGSDTIYVTDIDQGSLSFGGLEVRIRGNKGPLCRVDYSDGDEYLDLVCQFEDNSDFWNPGDGEATLTGTLMDGTEFEGTDSICVTQEVPQ